MSTVLFVTWNGGGNVRPVLATAADLRARGHDVHILSNLSMAERVAAIGVPFLPFEQLPPHDPASPETDIVRAYEGRSIAETNEIIGRRLVYGVAPAVCADTLAAIDACSPDLVVADYVLVGAMVAANARGCKLAVVSDIMYPLPYPERPRHASTYAFLFERLVNKGLPQLNALRAAHGLAALDSAGELYREVQRFVVMTYRTLGGFDLPAGGVYAGQQLTLPERLAPPRVTDTEPPLVLILFSSIHTEIQDECLVRLVDVLGAMAVRVRVGLGSVVSPLERLPENTEIERWIHLGDELPKASLLISHAGGGTVLRALAYGVPQLCVPFVQDQFDCARQIERLGVGFSVKKTASRDELTAAIRTLLGDRGYLEAARGAARSVYAEHEDQKAARVLEEIL